MEEVKVVESILESKIDILIEQNNALLNIMGDIRFLIFMMFIIGFVIITKKKLYGFLFPNLGKIGKR